MRIAFKDWTVAADPPGCGSRIIILRNGGIDEGRGVFKPGHPDFLFLVQ
jgi:hypothetical protein